MPAARAVRDLDHFTIDCSRLRGPYGPRQDERQGHHWSAVGQETHRAKPHPYCAAGLPARRARPHQIQAARAVRHSFVVFAAAVFGQQTIHKVAGIPQRPVACHAPAVFSPFGVEELPDGLACGRDLEEAAGIRFRDERVAVRQAFVRAARRRIETLRRVGRPTALCAATVQREVLYSVHPGR